MVESALLFSSRCAEVHSEAIVNFVGSRELMRVCFVVCAAKTLSDLKGKLVLKYWTFF